MKLSEMTTEQLQAKRARIDKILAARQNSFVELFKANHEKLVKTHVAAGCATFQGTFASFINKLFEQRMKASDIFDNNIYVVDSDDEQSSTSVFGDRAYLDDSGERWNDVPNSVQREWMYGETSSLNSVGARALLRVLGEEVTK